MIKLNILNMENFLKTVNTCKSEVHMLDSKGGKTNINGTGSVQERLMEQFFQSGKCLRLALEIPDPGDYMRIVSYYVGDC
ncbi:MAG: ribonuclease HII [Lachnospiraceae bacterium]|nr:ribonuclease HII [Lachnospiraceae bacterium]